MSKSSDLFQAALLRQANKARSSNDWTNACKYYDNYFKKSMRIEEQSDIRFKPEQPKILFNYLDCFLNFCRCKRSMNQFDKQDFRTISKYLNSFRSLYDQEPNEEILRMEDYIKMYDLFGETALLFKQFDIAEIEFENGYQLSYRNKCKLSQCMFFLLNKVYSLEKQNKFIDANEAIQKGIDEIEWKLKTISDDDDDSLIDLQKKFIDKRIIIEKKMKPTEENLDKRPDDIPERLTFKDHIFIYERKLKKKQQYQYVCKFGSDRHRKKAIRCEARIRIPVSIDFTKDNVESMIEVSDEKHTCNQEKGIFNHAYTEAMVKQKLEELYLSSNPRLTESQLIAKLYQIIEDETPENEERQTFSSLLLHNYISILEKKYNHNDTDFTEIFMTKRGDAFEMFKYRFPDGNKNSLIICYCSEFQRSQIPKSNYVFIDSTFSITPTNFAQVLVIMGQTENMNLPLCYMLLPNKCEQTYEKAFTLLKLEGRIKFKAGTTFLIDFEKAEYNALIKCFLEENQYVQLCYFHFCQAMRRHFQKYPQTKFMKQLNEIAYMLPFISEESVVNAIDNLYQYKETAKFARYFEKEYLNKFQFNHWSVYPKPEKETITNNVVESHNNLLSHRIGDGPSLKTFQTRLAEIENEYFVKYKRSVREPGKYKRATENDFNVKFKQFMAELRRSNSSKISPAKKVHHHDQYFIDDEDNSDLIMSFEESISEVEEKEMNKERTKSENEEDEMSKEGNKSENEEDEMSKEGNKLDNEENKEESDKEENKSENEDKESDKEEDKSENEEKNLKNKGNVGNKNDNCNIRNISKEAHEFLLQQMQLFKNEKPRSKERNQIVNDTLIKLSKTEPNISFIQIRSWFFNNKKKI